MGRLGSAHGWRQPKIGEQPRWHAYDESGDYRGLCGTRLEPYRDGFAHRPFAERTHRCTRCVALARKRSDAATL